MGLWLHTLWLESLSCFELSVFGINGLRNPVVLDFRVTDRVLIADLLVQNHIGELRPFFVFVFHLRNLG